MANRTPYFFLAPTWDCPPPPSGPIQLGNVITSVKKPERPLHRGTQPDSTYSSTQTRVTFSAEMLRAGRFGIFTRFLSLILGVGGDVSAGWEVSDASHFSFESLETTQFQPVSSYVQTCISAEPVQRYLEKSRYRKPVYIVTGLKTVRGAKVESRRARFLEGSVSAEVDGTAWTGAPVSGGLEAARKMGDRVALAWEGATDFVFAFRVQKVTVERKTGAGRSEDYKRGAMLDSEVEEKDRFELRIEEQDIDDHVDGFSEEELTEGDEVVLCALPDLQLDPAA